MIHRWDIFPATVLKTGLFETLHNYLYGISVRKLFLQKRLYVEKNVGNLRKRFIVAGNGIASTLFLSYIYLPLAKYFTYC